MKECKNDSQAIHPDDALSIVLSNIPFPAEEQVLLNEALGRVLLKEMFVTVDQPPFDKSSMDGYAYSSAQTDHSGLLRLIEVIPAGASMSRSLGVGECSRIMTGAPLPAGCIGVQRREFAEEADGFVRFTRPETVDNIIRRGENQKKGDVLLTPRRLLPQDIGLLVTSGFTHVPVASKVTVGIVSTGDELVENSPMLEDGKIYDSNGPQLCAQSEALGCDVHFYGIVPDIRSELLDVVSRSLMECDVTIVSGAVSLGDFDFVPLTFEELGVQKIFHGLKMRPGKPTYYGTLGGKSVFGLPGNPVSTFVNFEVLVKPHLFKRLGIEHKQMELFLPLSIPLKRKGSDRVEYLPARIESNNSMSTTSVRPLSYHGSSMLSALSDADCLVRMDLGVESIPEGGLVYVRLVRP